MNRATQQQAQPRRVDPADPIRCVSVISTGSVAFRPEHVGPAWKSTYLVAFAVQADFAGTGGDREVPGVQTGAFLHARAGVQQHRDDRGVAGAAAPGRAADRALLVGSAGAGNNRAVSTATASSFLNAAGRLGG